MTTIRRILVPVDFSSGADLAIETALALAGKLGAEVHVLHVWQPPPYMVPEMMVTVPGGAALPFDEFMRTRTKKDLDAFVRPHVAGGAVRPTAHVECGIPKDAIVRFAERNAVDLVVMGTHGHTGLMHVLMGSVAEHVVRHQPCPVLTVRYPAKEGQES
jgi:universal stress protein A